MKKFKLKDIDSIVGTHEQIRALIFENLKKEELLSSTAKELCYYCLKCFNFRRKMAIDDFEAIQKGCETVLRKAGFFRKLGVDNGKKTVAEMFNNEVDLGDTISLFIKEILYFDELPFKRYNNLKRRVESDLKIINDVVTFYESTDFIKKYKENKEKPKDHFQRTLRDFYLRCLEEREIVLNHYLDGIFHRSLQKAQLYGLNLVTGFQINEQYRDRPYRVWIPFSDSYFDYQKIDKCSHRVGDLPIQIARSLVQLYYTDKNKFYKKLKNYLPPSEIFKQINEYFIKILPRIEGRQTVFEELKFAFNKRKWHAFSALAIVQVEGLFSDMFKIIYHNKRPSGSLPDKVNAIRPNYHLHESHFDYFQYHLPNQRNSFLHFGLIKDEDPKIIAYDLLYDLHYILKVFDQLETPLVELRAILKRGSTNFLHGLTGYNHLFNLIKQVKDKNQFKEIEADWKDFEESILTVDGLLEYYAMELNEKFGAQLSSFYEDLKLFTEGELDLETVEWTELKSKKVEITKKIKSSTHIEEKFTHISEVNIFLKSYENILPHCPNDASEIFQKIKTENFEILKKISYLSDQLKS